MEVKVDPKIKTEALLEDKINDYCLKSKALIAVYCHTAKEVNADQPIDDVFERGTPVFLLDR